MSDGEAGTEQVRSAASSLFDLRTVIALLFGIYGVLLVIIALVETTPEQLAKAGGIHLNLWGGIVMLVVAVLFFLWGRLRPTKVNAPDGGLPGSGVERSSVQASRRPSVWRRARRMRDAVLFFVVTSSSTRRVSVSFQFAG